MGRFEKGRSLGMGWQRLQGGLGEGSAAVSKGWRCR